MHTGTGPFKIVRCSDPAISDPVGPAALKYSTTRDFSLLSFTDGMTPTVFHARLLTIAERRAVRNLPGDADKYEAAFVRGLVEVEGLVREEDGQPYAWKRPTDYSGKDKPIPDAVLEEHFDEATIQEIGMVILSRSFLAKTSGQYFPLPAICRDALSATLLRRALRAAQTSDSSSSVVSKSPAEACTPELPKSSPAGDASTGATATG